MADASAVDACRKGALAFRDHESGALVLVPTLCRQWGCPYCKHARYQDARARAHAGNPQRLLVLTLRPRPEVPLRDQIGFIRLSWRRLLQRIRRVYGPLEWMAALELQKNGTPHLHILFRGPYISQRWLAAAWQDLTGAYIVHISAIRKAPRAVAEVIKYLTKTASQIETQAHGVPVFTHSRGWLPLDFNDSSDPPGEWDFLCWLSLPWSDVEHMVHRLGGEIVTSSLGSRAFEISWRSPPDWACRRTICDVGTYGEISLCELLIAEFHRQSGTPDALAEALEARDMMFEPAY